MGSLIVKLSFQGIVPPMPKSVNNVSGMNCKRYLRQDMKM
jgi:hypothetical protein